MADVPLLQKRRRDLLLGRRHAAHARDADADPVAVPEHVPRDVPHDLLTSQGADSDKSLDHLNECGVAASRPILLPPEACACAAAMPLRLRLGLPASERHRHLKFSLAPIQGALLRVSACDRPSANEPLARGLDELGAEARGARLEELPHFGTLVLIVIFWKDARQGGTELSLWHRDAHASQSDKDGEDENATPTAVHPVGPREEYARLDASARHSAASREKPPNWSPLPTM
mmetsp:Transcript_51851/g.136233  ORF Transcript_51851/g.136233 Transcript_51851/m.136233 type:complete len:232 (-) Transcript_51851:1981-2676(-)